MPAAWSFGELFGRGSTLMLVGGMLAALAIVLLATALSQFIYGDRRNQLSSRRRRLGVGGGLIRLLLVLLLLTTACAILLGGVSLRTYTVFTREELVGTLDCLRWNNQDRTMVVRFSPVQQGRVGAAVTYALYGDQWEINAHILKWTPAASLLGFSTAYRLNQIKGTYQQAEDESRRPHQAYTLSAGRDWLWWALSKYGRYLPGVEAVYGNAVSLPPQAGEQFDVFVTTSGLLTKPRK